MKSDVDIETKTPRLGGKDPAVNRSPTSSNDYWNSNEACTCCLLGVLGSLSEREPQLLVEHQGVERWDETD